MSGFETRVEQALQQAIVLHRDGRLQDAERLYRGILQTRPDHPEANHNLGVLAVQVGRPVAALPHFEAALKATPNQAQYWVNYIDALIRTGQFNNAKQCLEQARQRGWNDAAFISLADRLAGPEANEPDPLEISALQALFNAGQYLEATTLACSLTVRYPGHGFSQKILGVLYRKMGQIADALASMQRAVGLLPDDAEAHANLGNTLLALSRPEEAEFCYRRALELKADYAEVYSNLGNALKEQGRTDEAETSLRRALAIRPNLTEAQHNLANALQDKGELDDAADCYRRVLALVPDFIEAHFCLGNVLVKLGRLNEAETCYRRTLEIKPDHVAARTNLSLAFYELGRLTEAEANCRLALEIDPDFFDARSHLLFLLNYSSCHPPAYCFEEASQCGHKVANKVTTRFTEWTCEKQPQRLRIGFVSGDLADHPVGYFIESLLAQLDPDAVELIAYAASLRCDELTARIKPRFTHWRSLHGLSDEVAARLIHRDAVHVLIDLSGHTQHSRLPVFAWKPAPVQVSWLGYFATTGIAEIDYLVADAWTLPNSEETFFTEKIWRLPETRLCFTPPEVGIEVSELPALKNGYITFGCFNNLNKMSDVVVALWASVLASVPNSRLFLKARQLNEASVRQNTTERFAAHGIAADRLILEAWDSRENYLAAYHRVDMALDPFPYPGGTTSCEGLWMGVPVLTLAGERFLSRQGVGILMNAGLPEWIATDCVDYVARAVRHATDLQALSDLRKGLRQQVLQSPLFDAPRFAKNLEAALRSMWVRWCNNSNGLASPEITQLPP